MNALGDADLLAIWDRGCARHALDRAVIALAAATGETPRALADRAIGERDALLFALYRRSFGAQVDGTASCPACGVQVEVVLEIDRLCPPGTEEVTAAEIVVEDDGVRAVCRQPTSRDLAACVSAPSADDARAALLAACVRSEGALPPALIEKIEHALAEMTPPVERALSLACPACAHAWSAPFDVADAVWSVIDVRARRLMEVVAALAERYGWSESDTLALAPARRAYYLERPA